MLGTITVVDTRPRVLTRDGQAALEDIAVATMGLLERRRKALHFKRLARTDYLTGLSNRAQFQRVLQTVAAHARRTAKPFSVLCLDLNDFKAINDRFGHAAGDTVLSEVARRLQAQVRADDVVSRIGGDEFGIIMQDCDREKATVLRERISAAMAKPILLAGGHSVKVGISIGAASNTQSSLSETELLAQADAELYRVKRRSGVSR